MNQGRLEGSRMKPAAGVRKAFAMGVVLALCCRASYFRGVSAGVTEERNLWESTRQAKYAEQDA